MVLSSQTVGTCFRVATFSAINFVVMNCNGDYSQPVPPLRLVVPRTYPAGQLSVDRAALDLDSQPVPPLRLVVPRTYPAGQLSVDRAALDLDSFFFDDLQNVIHERLARPGLSTIADYLETWESTVRSYYMGQQQQTSVPTSFDDIFQTTTFDDILS
uniref:Mediator of RNA polymerase II transcription subunit 15 n=1 Tax=Ascaris lumbricoides TaxID=6252 RepID=A0A0M3IM82_ASCLU